MRLTPGLRVQTAHGPGTIRVLTTLPSVWPQKRMGVAIVQLDGHDHRRVFPVSEITPLEEEGAA